MTGIIDCLSFPGEVGIDSRTPIAIDAQVVTGTKVDLTAHVKRPEHWGACCHIQTSSCIYEIQSINKNHTRTLKCR